MRTAATIVKSTAIRLARVATQVSRLSVRAAEVLRPPPSVLERFATPFVRPTRTSSAKERRHDHPGLADVRDSLVFERNSWQHVLDMTSDPAARMRARDGIAHGLRHLADVQAEIYRRRTTGLSACTPTGYPSHTPS